MFKRNLLIPVLLFSILIILLGGCAAQPEIGLKMIEETNYTGDSHIRIEPQSEKYSMRDIVTVEAYPKDKFKFWKVTKADKDETVAQININPQEFKLAEFKNIEAVFADTEIKLNIKKTTKTGFLGESMQLLLGIAYDFTGSYGLAIILLTVIIKLILFPLTHKQSVSMKKMQSLQPELKKLKDKYGNDQKKMQEESMKLYQEHNINPLSGCVPLFIQMPFIIALFRAIKGWEAMNGQPFLFIPDLSGSYFPLVILTGIAMLLQSLLTQNKSTTTFKSNPSKYLDENKMVLIMPVFIMFIGANFPAGLLLYWFVSTLISVLQQYIVTKSSNVELEGKVN